MVSLLNKWFLANTLYQRDLFLPTHFSHTQTFSFDEKGNDPSVDLAKAMNILRDAGYNGIWGIESVPRDGDEYEGARKTIALIKRVLGE